MSLNSTVISLVPFEIQEEKPGLIPSRYLIEPSDMKTPQLLHVATATHYVYLDESRGSLRVPDPSDQVAKSIVDDYVTSQLGVDDDSKPALFWVPEEVSLDEVKDKFKVEIVRYLLLQKKWFLNVSMLADNDWSRYHQHNVISSFQRKAADIIGWKPSEHEWMSPMTTMESTSCPACGMNVVKGVIICPNCKVILDKSRYEEFQFAQTR